MRIKYVEISNILSIKNIRLEFQDSGLVLLDGYNHDDDTANGAGKTAIFNSLCFGLFGKLPRKISASEILREGTKSGFVSVGVEVGESLFEVKRSRPNSLKFSIDGVDKNMTQEEFEGHIKMNYSQYLISMYSAQTEGSKLISLNDSGKKDFFLQLMNLDSFEECKKEIDAALKIQQTDKVKLETAIAEIRARIDTYKESVVDEQELLDELESIPLKKIQQQISKYSAVQRPDVSKYDDLEKKLFNAYRIAERSEDENESNLREIGKIEAKIRKLSTHVSDSIECPHCNKSFIPGQDAISKEVEDLKSEIIFIRESLIDAQDLMDTKQELENRIVKCRSKRDIELEEYNTIREKLAQLTGQVSSMETKIHSIKRSIDGNKLLKDKILENDRKLSLFSDRLAILESEIVISETLRTIFSSTGAPAYVMDSAIDVFNERVSHYTSMIWPNATYALLSFRENKTGELKAKFSEKLIIGGKDRSIGALSGGEHRCLSLAVDFAVVDVLETMFGVSINPIMLDEPFNDLDASNRERVLDLLDKISINRQIWVIDHASEAKAMFSTIVRVEKRSGISSIVI